METLFDGQGSYTISYLMRSKEIVGAHHVAAVSVHAALALFFKTGLSKALLLPSARYRLAGGEIIFRLPTTDAD
jgi:hypothetical protein